MTENFFPDDYQECLFKALSINNGDEVSPAFLEPLFKFNQTWVNEQKLIDYDATLMIQAYTAYYMTINMPKLWFLINRIGPLFESNEPRQITEFGCGPGTYIWSLLFYLKKNHLLDRVKSIEGIDINDDFLSIAKKLQKAFSFDELSATFRKLDWQTLLNREYDILIIGNSITENPDLNEMLFKQIRARTIILIEPGTHRSFQNLLKIRNTIMETDDYKLTFPCPSFHDCPMSETDNWCHFHINRFSLPFIQRMSNKAKRLNPRHHFSAFVFDQQRNIGESDEWLILSGVRRASRSAIRWICNGETLIEVVLNRRDKADGSRLFTSLPVGSKVKIVYHKDKQMFIKSRRLTNVAQVQLSDG